MVALTQHHQPRLHSPYYADAADGTLLHRYLEDEFVPRFLQDARAGRLTRAADQPWRAADRFAPHRDHPVLRLPMHRAFYIACCEVSCDTIGAPALDPAKIMSAGLVIRRRGPDGPERWVVREGEPLGWGAGPIPDHDPDDYRRLRAHDLIPAQAPEPPYSGEQTHPLHPQVISTPGPNGRPRSRTLLFGYVPLGGSARVNPGNRPEPQAGASLDPGAEYQWPFRPSPGRTWAAADGLVVTSGQPSAAFLGVLANLVGRYRIQDASDPGNAPLRTLLGRVRFLQAPPSLAGLGSAEPYLDPATQGETLLQWLEGAGDALLGWLSRRERGQGDPRLPNADGSPRSGFVYVSQAQAAQFQDLLVLRATQAAEVGLDDLPVARFGQDRDDVFFAVPFVRYRDDCGCERLAWGPPTPPFRVAGPFDPDAQRPQLITLPGLDDIKRGAARGVTFLAPKSLADKIRSLKLDMDAGEGGPGNGPGSCWSFSFSLPAITLCAMILLMIILSLLNLLFFWLPWVFLALPRLCLKAAVRIGSGGVSGSVGGGAA